MFSDFNNGRVLFCLYCSSCLPCLLPDQGHQAPQFQLPGHKGYPRKWLSSDAGQSVAQIFSTGNSAIDGGIIGLGLGALGAAVLGPTLNQVVSPLIICLFVKPNCFLADYLSSPIFQLFVYQLFVKPNLPQAVSAPQTGCGRRKRQADGEER